MDKKMVLKTQANKEVVSLSDFIFDFDDILKRVIFKLHVNYEIFDAKSVIEVEEYDLLNLKKNLNEIYNGNYKTCIFNPMGDLLNIKFDLLENGVLDVELQLNNSMFTSSLNIKFSSDVTFIPYLIKDLELIINQHKI